MEYGNAYCRVLLCMILSIMRRFFLVEYCLIDGHVLMEDMSYKRTCLQEDMSNGGHVLQEDLSYWRPCLTE